MSPHGDGAYRVFAALAERRAVKSGEDPDMAVDIADGEASIRHLLRSVQCPHPPCNAAIGEPCVDYRGRPLTKSPVHPSRGEAAMSNNQTDTRGAA